MVDARGPASSMRDIDGEYRDGVIVLPSSIQTEWDARGIKKVRISAEVLDESDHSLLNDVMRTQQIDRSSAQALLNAAGSLAGSEIESRIQQLSRH